MPTAGRNLQGHLFVGLAEDVPSLRVADEDVAGSRFGRHRSRGLTGEGAPILPMDVLCAQLNPGIALGARRGDPQ